MEIHTSFIPYYCYYHCYLLLYILYLAAINAERVKRYGGATRAALDVAALASTLVHPLPHRFAFSSKPIKKPSLRHIDISIPKVLWKIT